MLPAEEPERLAEAVDDARRGVITHVTFRGERVAAIVPEALLEAIRRAEDAADAADAAAARGDPGEDVPWEQARGELGQ